MGYKAIYTNVMSEFEGKKVNQKHKHSIYTKIVEG